MCYADAWFDGIATLGGVEARRADRPTEFLCGMQTRQFLPLLLRPFEEVVERWPWDVIIAAPDHDGRPARALANLAELTIGVGSGFVAGDRLRSGDRDRRARSGRGAARRRRAAAPPRRRSSRARLLGCDRAPPRARFAARKTIGDRVEAEEILGFLGEEPVRAPVAGRISGLARPEQMALPGAPIAEIATSERAPVAGVGERNKLIARGVSFAVEMEAGGWTPVSIGSR